MTNNESYWLWLYQVLGPCSAKFVPLLDDYGSAQEIYKAKETPQIVARLAPNELKNARTTTLESCSELAATCEKQGIAIVTFCDEAYPERLKNTRIPPILLFVTGHADALNEVFAIAGVGARFSTQYGREAVKYICTPLAKAGVCLVSGLAYGIDAEVHKIALENGAKTVAVLGTAIDLTYPANHRDMRAKIESSGGAVVSEYLPGSVVGKFAFAQRNRIVSGLAQSVIIFEAAKKSGTMITATWALDDGREVFAVPGSILSAHSEGTNYLIKHGATPALNALDILHSLDLREFDYEQLELELEPKKVAPLSANKKKLCDVLTKGECTADTLIDETGLAPHIVLSELTELEMDGIVSSVAGSKYALK